MKKLIPLIGFVVISVFLYLSLSSNPRELPSPFLGKAFPDIEVEDFYTGEKFSLRDTFKDKITLVNVWASWCVSCRAEHVLLNEIARDRQVEIVGLNYKDTRADARAWLDQLGNPYTAIAVDTEGKVGIDWGVYGVPETFVIDAQGLIRYKHIGPLERVVLKQKILPLVRQLKRTSA